MNVPELMFSVWLQTEYVQRCHEAFGACAMISVVRSNPSIADSVVGIVVVQKGLGISATTAINSTIPTIPETADITIKARSAFIWSILCASVAMI
jgi:hypothetical protein